MRFKRVGLPAESSRVHPMYHMGIARDAEGALPLRGIAATLMMVGPLAAQTTLGVGALRGVVLDPSQQLVAGAKVALIETSKGLVRQSESGGDGSFIFLSVP